MHDGRYLLVGLDLPVFLGSAALAAYIDEFHFVFQAQLLQKPEDRGRTGPRRVIEFKHRPLLFSDMDMLAGAYCQHSVSSDDRRAVLDRPPRRLKAVNSATGRP